MKIKPLTQLREMISKALSGQTNLSKSFQSFFIEAMELFLTIPNRINYEQRGKSGIKMLPLCRNYQRRMVTPDYLREMQLSQGT